ncbi:ABC transporter substrate-binding protein [Collinsella sp. zg1085]|uniref:peptide ABC transporter substrate-binding protein n=1 Tax=Collinsella sp. zg1085 TaxID=2844380 RepID=UPI001C0C0F56|nr:ABC transporter substrate-binding protein [Collinsella sp. zg1085]QWT17196.1 ABC transporter substrate-binding protein [Collinsella sp. zg1085]
MAETKVTRRAFVGGSLATGVLATLAACGKKSDGGAAGSAAAAAGATFTMNLNTPKSIDPYNAQEDQGIQVDYQLFDPLTEFDYNKNELVGLAAKSWDVNETATEFTFHLVEGAKFHNGEPVNAESFKRAWTRIVDPKSAIALKFGPSEIGYHLSMVDGYDALQKGESKEFTGVVAKDDNTLVVKLNMPYGDFPYVVSHIALSPVPKVADTEVETYYYAPVGNGPFKMDGKWEDGQYIHLMRNDDYYGSKAKISAIHFNLFKDVETAFKEFQAGNLDLVDVPVPQIESTKKDRGVSKDGYNMSDGQRMLMGAQPATYYLLLNVTKAPFNNADLRRGVSLAINRAAITDTIFKGSRTPAGGLIPPGIDGYREGAWPYAKYDVAKANEYLDKVAPMNGDSRGINLTLSYNQDGGHKEIMESIIGDLAKVGVTVTSDTPDWTALLTQYQEGNFEFGRLGWTADYPIMDNFLYPLLHTDSLEGDNRSGYSNPEFDKMVNEARTTIDAAERIKKMQAADDMAGEDSPVIPIMYYCALYAGSDRVKKLYCNPQKQIDMSSIELSA